MSGTRRISGRVTFSRLHSRWFVIASHVQIDGLGRPVIGQRVLPGIPLARQELFTGRSDQARVAGRSADIRVLEG